jgi:hypothetical protein
LSKVRLGDLGLDKVRQGFDQPPRQRRTIVPPAPDGHLANAERAGGGGIATKSYLKDQIVPAGGQTALEAR